MEYGDLSRKQLAEALELLDKELKETEEEREEYKSLAKKHKADLENYRKKEDERKKRWKRKARKELAEDLVEVMDNMERAIAMADEDSKVLQGVKMVADQMYETLQKRGLERIEAEGEEFDPELHKAVETREHEEENRVLEEKRKGYMFEDKVLREAEVVVSEKEGV